MSVPSWMDALAEDIAKAVGPRLAVITERLKRLERDYRLARGDAGPMGPAGPPGAHGQDGRDGRDGLPGRDAARLEILPAVDPEKTYPPGTWAACRGGLLCAYRLTDPLAGRTPNEAGWTVVLNGLAAITPAAVDADRHGLQFRLESTDGVVHAHMVHIPFLMYRDIYREAETYRHGDVVTSNGALWHCLAAATTQRPPSDDWQLIVQRGRPGKDGKDGAPGTPGPEGRPGKDLTQMNWDGRKY
jgi:hypothetical protein